MKELNQNVFGVPNSQMTRALENKLQKEQTHIRVCPHLALQQINMQAIRIIDL